MLALRKTVSGPGLDLAEIPHPGPPAAGEVLIEVSATGICGSDLHIETWGESYRKFMTRILPVTLGHETAGRVVETGAGVTAPAVGQRVVINPAVACGRCARCLAGDPVGCVDRQAVGMVRDGAFARYVVAPAEYCYPLPDSVADELGALVEPLSVGAHALAVGGFEAGQRVVVFGPGPIGQGTAVLARELGASEVAIVGRDDPVRFATLRELGFDLLFDLADPAAAAGLKAVAAEGFDLAIDAAGVPVVIDQALRLLRSQGVLAVAGMSEEPSRVDILLVVKNRLQIRGVSRIPPAAWTTVIDLMRANPAAFAKLISHRLPLSEAKAGFELCHSRQASKVLLLPT
jgi:2-desacetyl-2-hydroxyethyl bacteriochlorophyllide A dehydrogenase